MSHLNATLWEHFETDDKDVHFSNENWVFNVPRIIEMFRVYNSVKAAK